MDATATDDHHDLFAGFAKDAHDLVEVLAEFLRIKMGHDLIKDARGPLLNGPNDAEQDHIGDAAPGTIAPPGLAPVWAELTFQGAPRLASWRIMASHILHTVMRFFSEQSGYALNFPVLLADAPPWYAFRTIPTCLVRMSQKVRDACAIVSLVYAVPGVSQVSGHVASAQRASL
jgi:hypothetical protein